MFARYEYRAGTTLANFIADVTAILTGTTDKATLSADCVQATTEIISTVAAGWVMHDAAAGTNKVCLKSLNVDGVTYKYMTLDFNTTNQITILGYESWNASTHVGVNPTYYYGSNGYFTISITSGGTLFLFSSNRYAVLCAVSSTFVWEKLVGIVEYTRDDPWNTVANGYPAYGLFSSNALANCAPATSSNFMFNPPRVKDLTGDKTGSNASLSYNTVLTIPNSPVYIIPQLMNVNGEAYYPLVLIRVSIVQGLPIARTVGMLGGSLIDIYLITNGIGANGDEVTYNGAQYFIHKANSVSIAIQKF